MKQKFFFGISAILIATLFLMTDCKPKCSCDKEPYCDDCPEPPPPCPATTPPADGYEANFPDGRFENGFIKDAIDGVEFETYVNDLLRTINDLYALSQDIGGPGPLTTFKECSDIDGFSALKLKTGFLPGFQDGVLIPGAIGTLSNNFIAEFLDSGGIGTKRPFTQKPVAFKGYMKYEPVSGDSAAVEIEIYNGNDVIGSGILVKKSAIGSYTPFEVPITYKPEFNNLPATHLKLIMSASAAYNFNDLLNCKGQIGSTLYIDRVWWQY